MTAVTASARTLLAAIHRPCPGCRWCQTRRVLTAVWRGLVMASRVAMALPRALAVCVGITAITFAVLRECGPLLGIAAVVAWAMAGAALVVFLARWDGR